MFNFEEIQAAFKTSRPFSVTLFFESEQGSPRDSKEWFEKLKYLSNSNDTLHGVIVTKYKMQDGEVILYITKEAFVNVELNTCIRCAKELMKSEYEPCECSHFIDGLIKAQKEESCL